MDGVINVCVNGCPVSYIRIVNESNSSCWSSINCSYFVILIIFIIFLCFYVVTVNIIIAGEFSCDEDKRRQGCLSYLTNDLPLPLTTWRRQTHLPPNPPPPPTPGRV